MPPLFRMFHSGLLVLTSPLSHLHHQMGQILRGASDHVENTLYVHLAPGLKPPASASQPLTAQHVPVSQDVKHIMKAVYSHAASSCNHIDVYLLLGNIADKAIPLNPSSLKHGFDVLLAEPNTIVDDTFLLQYVKQNFSVQSDIHFKKVDIGGEENNASGSKTEAQDSTTDGDGCRVYDNVVLGGTFDRLHMGHKILLSEASILCKNSITVGVTEGKMNAKKTLCELIEPVEKRIHVVTEFLNLVKPSIKTNVVPITDPFGPSIVDPDLQCIVVSQETLGGGNAVNKRRNEKGLSTLDVDVIELIEDIHHSPEEEEKISSSSQRKRTLGTLLKPPKRDVHSRPYILGLTGGIASGKSSICKRLAKLGAGVVDCDKLGHAAYEKGTSTQQRVVEAFGPDILTEDGQINRKALGAKVFSDKTQLDKLNSIVWPAIAELANDQIAEYARQGVEVVVMDAAVLLEAGWDVQVHEVWVSIIPTSEAVRRIMERNKLSEAEAVQRIESQLTNHQRVAQANVVLSTLWDYPVTQKQVERAWQLLKSRMSST